MKTASSSEDDWLGIHETSVTCKVFAAFLCVSSVAAGSVTLVAVLKAKDPMAVYRQDYAVRRELPRSGPWIATAPVNPHGVHGPGAVPPEGERLAWAHGKGKGRGKAAFFEGLRHRGRGKGRGWGRGKGGGRGGRGGPGFDSPFGHEGVKGPTGDFLWERGAGRRGHHVESGIGPMQVRAADYDEAAAVEKVRKCLLNLDRSGAPMVLGEKGFVPSPAAWLQRHEDNVEVVQAAIRRTPQPKRLLLGDAGARGLARSAGAGGSGIDAAATLALSIDGDRSGNLLWRLRHGELPRHLHPEAISLVVGGDDLTGGRELALDAPLRTALAICAVVRHVRHQGLHAPLTLAKIPPRGAAWPRGPAADAVRRANRLLDALVRGASPTFNLRLADCEATFVDSGTGKINEELMPDHAHPSEKGYAAWYACLAASQPATQALHRRASLARASRAPLARASREAAIAHEDD